MPTTPNGYAFFCSLILFVLPIFSTAQVGNDAGENARQHIRDAAVHPEKAALGAIDEPMALKDVSVWSPTYPVLTGKDDNPILRVRIDASGFERALPVTGMSFDLSASDDVKDIRYARLYYTGSSPNFSAGSPFGERSEGKEQIAFEGLRNLQPGPNYFWLSFSLREDADLLHQLGAAFDHAVVDKKAVRTATPYQYPRKRIGRALRQHMDDGVHTFRIPGLATTNEGTLIAVYDVRRESSVDLQGDVDVGMSRSTDGGQTWAPMEIILDMGRWGGLPEDQNGVGDPAVLVDRETNTIWVAGLWAHGHPGRRSWFASQRGLAPGKTNQMVLVKSEDDGQTWSAPINITEQIKDPNWHLLLQGPGRGITMKDGTLVFPAQFKDGDQIPHATIIYSRDRGQTWRIGTGAKSHTTEAQVVELRDGSLMLNMRDDRGGDEGGKNGTGARSIAVTKDLGKTWIEHPTSRRALPEPVCMASILKHDDAAGQSILLFSNPRHRYHRENMTIQLSKDEGSTWPEKFHLLLDEGQGRGYSCLTMIGEDTIGILYEGSGADLVFQKVSLRDLVD
jgi:sialidase-1